LRCVVRGGYDVTICRREALRPQGRGGGGGAGGEQGEGARGRAKGSVFRV
jgi:hypothetical protein